MTGRCILNLGNPGFAPAGAYPTINWFKNAILFNPVPSGSPISGIDGNGVLTTAPVSDFYGGQIGVPFSYSGAWVFKFSGTGRLRLDFDVSGFTISSGAGFTSSNPAFNQLDMTGTNPRIVFTMTTPSLSNTWEYRWLSAGTYSGMGPPVLCRLADEAALDAGELFNPDFINAIKSINPRALRFMQWQNAATGIIGKPYTYQTPESYMWWTGLTFPLGAYAGTIAGTNTYTCSAPPDVGAGALAAGQTIVGFVTNASGTTNSTLRVGSQAAKPIWGADALPMSTTTTGTIGATSLACFTYDATAGAYIFNAGGVGSCMPLSAMVKLCNECNVHMWFNFNVECIDAEVTSIATYIKNNLNSGLTAYFEFANEVWGGVGFFNINIVQSWASPLSLPAGYGDAQALRIRQIMGLVTSAWSGRSMTTLKRVYAEATFSPPGIAAQMNGSNLGAYGFSSSPNRPVDFTDTLSYAPYYEGPNCPAFPGGYVSGAAQQSLYDAADNYASGNSTLIASALDFVDNDVKAGTGGNGDVSTIDYQNTNVYPPWETLAASFDSGRSVPLTIECYEGGLQIGAANFAYPSVATINGIGKSGSTYGGPTGRIAILFAAYKNDIRWYNRLLYQLNQFIASGPHAFSPCWYDFVDGGLEWSTHPGDLYSTPYQTLRAITAFNNPPSSTLGSRPFFLTRL